MELVKISFVLFLLVLGNSVSSQSLQHSDSVKFICREWKFKEAHSDNFEDNSEESKDIIKNTRMLFKQDNSYVFKFEGEIVEKGKWEYINSKREIVKTTTDGEKTTLKILFLSESLMKFDTINATTGVYVSGTLIPSK